MCIRDRDSANTLDDASVWFEYPFPAVTTQDAFTVTVTPTGSPAINTPLVAIYEGCNASDVVTDDDGNDCNATATLRCPVPGTTYLIMVDVYKRQLLQQILVNLQMTNVQLLYY